MMETIKRYMQVGGGSVADASEILMLLGRLAEGVEQLRRDFDADRESAAANRRLVHDRHDAMTRELTQLRQDIEVAAVISAQGRDDVKRLGEQIDAHKAAVQPSLDDWQRIKAMGLGITGILALGGLSVGAVLASGIDTFKSFLRSWLGG